MPGGGGTRTGTQTAVGFNSTSDSSFKTNIAPVTDALDKVAQLNGIYYDWLHTNPNYDFAGTQQIGFIAQDVQAVIPEVVHVDTNGFYTLDYGRIVPVLAEAIKEQQQIIVVQQNSIDSLNSVVNSIPNNNSLQTWKDSIENCLAQLPPGLACSSQQNKLLSPGTQSGYDNGKYCITSVITIEPDNTMLSKETALEQNKPNPFRYRTQFEYYIGEAGHVELLIHSPEGKHIATLADERQPEGSYTVNWETSDLSPGLYFYTLKVDGVEWVKKAVRVK